MDTFTNPFSPGAGRRPPELAGRDDVLRQGAVLLGRVIRGRSEKSLLLIGLRGVGKTVLLNAIERNARADGYHTTSVEATEDMPLGTLLAPYLKTVLYEMDRLAGAGNQVKRGLAVLKGFIGSLKVTTQDLTIGFDISPEQGTADSGSLDHDLPALFVTIAEAAAARKTAVALFIDELQYLNQKELGALIMAMHRLQQKELPFVLVGAGLPILPALAGEAKSYSERLFDYPEIGALSQGDTARALQDPVQEVGVEFTNEALSEIYRLTQGYPYFIQEWGYQSWNLASGSPITLEAVQDATAIATARLDQNFFRVRYDRLTPSEKVFLRGMAEVGTVSIRMGDLAETMGVKIASLGPRRASLIKKGMIYSPAYGEIAFTVPLFDEFMKRVIPEFA